MYVISDTHSHIYDCYDLEQYLKSSFENFSRHKKGESVFCLFLTQSAKNSPSLESLVNRIQSIKKYTVKYENGIIRVEYGKDLLFIIPGRQFITKENIEVLALAYTAAPLDGMGLNELVDKLALEGVPTVLPWSPGKWIGSRGKMISELILSEKAWHAMLGDIPMRAFGSPAQFTLSKRILAGSDTLPIKGEEAYVGNYVSIFDADISTDLSLISFRKILLQANFTNSGVRNSIFTAFKRWGALFCNKFQN